MAEPSNTDNHRSYWQCNLRLTAGLYCAQAMNRLDHQHGVAGGD